MKPFLAALALLALLSGGHALAQGVERSGGGASVVREPLAVPGTGSARETPPSVERSAQQGKRAASETPLPAVPPERAVAEGWELFSQGDFAAASSRFAQALEQGAGETLLQARLGLGFAAMRLQRLDEAQTQFQTLVDKGYRLPESLPALLTVQRARGDKAALEKTLALLPEAQRAQWREPVPIEPVVQAAAPTATPDGVRQALARAGSAPDARRLAALLKEHSPALERCADADVFLKIAQGLAGVSRQDEARSVLDRLAACPRQDFGVRLGVLYELAALESPAVVRQKLERYRQASPPSDPARAEALRRLALTLDRKEMGDASTSQARKLQLARDILAADPADPDARAALAWDDLANGRAAQAQRAFRELAGAFPKRLDLQLGLGYANLRLGLLDEALGVAASSGHADDPAMRDLAYQVHVKQAFTALDAKDPALAARQAEAARALQPGGGELAELDAWIAQARGEDAKALKTFSDRYAATGDKRFLAPMAQGYAATGQRVKAFETAARMAQDPETKSAAADFYATQKAPILAASTGTDGCCTNADTPQIDALGFVRSKTGDKGTSRLLEWSVPARYSWALPSGMRFTAGASAHFLSSGDAPQSPYAGSYFARVAGTPQRNALLTDLTVYTPLLALDVEGPYRWRLEAGTSPIGGPVAPLPTFAFSVSTPEWELAVHQKAVTESILSWTGLRDPYGSRSWGRVLRTGGRGKITFTPAKDWFITTGGQADYLWGENVEGNAGLSGNLSAGRTFRFQEAELALGAFATLKHYAVNSNFYTVGHGGYYSPDLLFIAGPFARLRTPECRTWWLDVEGSVGWLYENNAGAPKYPLGSSTAGLTSGQITELGGRYAAKTETKLAYSAKGEALLRITPHVAAGVFGGVSNASDYTEAYGGLGLRWSWDPQKAFWAPKELFRRQTPFDRD
ncbi:Cellulose synthase operon protein C [Fundidesulfovibrio magnetotacticus]|uniref:Cellulose synthase operon protein C n=1 Tax=Fundidesulfovibrio magnetotacticus TaxID=2730080 RepID=A0A6V8M679_9BACT|nr:cellulose synthase subunit BcsC-related outer membrane protein [Fundidesulfovibrio magnetotacticus]GFK96125.1 Cellulose synthase operon protein C [Fundidesulfovibrio magnetotacticus]